MKYILITTTIILSLLSCNEEETKINVVQVIEEVETVKSIENPNIEIITDLEVINELKADLIKERKKREQLHLATLSISERFIAGDSLISDSILNLLNNGNHSERSNFLHELLLNKTPKFKIINNEIEQAIINQINDTVIERQAMKTIGALNLNYNNAFQKKFNDSNNSYPEKYFYWLGRKGKSIDALNSISSKIKKGKLPKNQQDDIIFGLEQFSHSRNKEIKQKTLSILLLAYKNKIITAKEISTLKQEDNRSEKAKSFVKSIIRNGDNKSKSIISLCLKNNIYIKESFQNLIRNNSEKLKPMLLKQLGSKRSIVQSLPAVPPVYKFLKDSTIPIKLLKSIEKQGDYSTQKLEQIYVTFKKMGALNWYKKADRIVKNKKLIDGLKKFKEQPVIIVDYDEMASNIFHLGLTDSLPPNTIEEIKTNGIYADENSLLKNILSYSNKLLTIEKLAPASPIDYLDLFKSFKNKFPKHLSGIEFVSQYENNDYSWLVIGENIAIIAHPKNNDDLYDIKLFLSVINKIKSTSKFLHVLSSNEDEVDVFLGNQKEINNAISLLVSKIN